MVHTNLRRLWDARKKSASTPIERLLVRPFGGVKRRGVLGGHLAGLTVCHDDCRGR